MLALFSWFLNFTKPWQHITKNIIEMMFYQNYVMKYWESFNINGCLHIRLIVNSLSSFKSRQNKVYNFSKGQDSNVYVCMETSTLMKLNEKISVTVLFPYSQQAYRRWSPNAITLVFQREKNYPSNVYKKSTERW